MPQLTEPNQVGKREDLADLIAVVDAREMPLTSMIPKGKKLGNMHFSWQDDSFEDPSYGGVPDGLDVQEYEDAGRKRALLEVYGQAFRRTAKVGWIAEEVSNVAGVQEGEIARAVAKKTVEIKRDIETALLSDNECQADDGKKGYKLRGLGRWIQTSAQSLFPVPADYRPAAAQVCATACASLVENDLMTVLKAVWDAGVGSVQLTAFAGSTFRAKFTDFTRTGSQTGSSNDVAGKVRVFSGAMDDKTVTHTTQIYEGDFNLVQIVPSAFIRWQTTVPDVDCCYIVDMKQLQLRWGILPEVKVLPDLGGGPRRLIQGACGLLVKNPKGLAKFQP